MNHNDIVADTIAADFGLVRQSGHWVCSLGDQKILMQRGKEARNFLRENEKV